MKLNKKINKKTLSAYFLHEVFPFMSQNNRLGHSSTLRVRPSQCTLLKGVQQDTFVWETSHF